VPTLLPSRSALRTSNQTILIAKGVLIPAERVDQLFTVEGFLLVEVIDDAVFQWPPVRWLVEEAFRKFLGEVGGRILRGRLGGNPWLSPAVCLVPL
jgi:hypothetical protein